MYMVVNQDTVLSHCATWIVVGGNGGKQSKVPPLAACAVLCCGKILLAFDDPHSVYTTVFEKKILDL